MHRSLIIFIKNFLFLLTSWTQFFIVETIEKTEKNTSLGFGLGKCPTSGILCDNATLCIPKMQVCDSVRNCMVSFVQIINEKIQEN